ncbi:MAG: cytidylyltransferase [Nanoarchaeota archaeon]
MEKELFIPALIIGRGKHQGIKMKNLYPILGRPLMAYPIMAAKNCKRISKVYLSTESEEMKNVGREYGIEIIDRPEYLSREKTLPEDVYLHGFNEIKKLNPDKEIKMVVLMVCNGATTKPQYMEEGISVLLNDPKYDSAITVSNYDMYSPSRAMKIEGDVLKPYMGLSDFKGLSDDRQSLSTWFLDINCMIVKPHWFDYGKHGQPQFRWTDKVIYPIRGEGIMDLDEEWQIPLIENWLRKEGYTEKDVPEWNIV